MHEMTAKVRAAYLSSALGRLADAFRRGWRTSLLRALFVWLLTRPYPYVSSAHQPRRADLGRDLQGRAGQPPAGRGVLRGFFGGADPAAGALYAH